MFQNEKGFTLNEILITLVIITIIMGLGSFAVWNMITDTDVQEYVSNAKNVEESAEVYYRDNGVLPYSEVVNEVSEDAKSVMVNELNKLQVPNASEVVDTLVNEGYLYTLNYEELREYTRVNRGDSGTEGVEEFLIINIVDKGDLSTFNGLYDNDIAGYVFSRDVVKNSNSEIYSGGYLLNLDDPADEFAEAVEGSELYPYYLRIDNIEDNEDNTVDITFSWEDTWVYENGSRARGYSATEFELSYGGNIEVVENTSSFDGRYVLRNFTIVDDDVIFNLKGKDMIYLGNENVGDSNTKTLEVNIRDYIDGSREGNEICIDGGDLCEIVGGDDYEDRNDLYEKYVELEISPDNVQAVEEGLQIDGLDVGTRIVLKEVRRSGGSVTFDENRTRLFKANSTGVLIPKNPYLQKDFQENPESNFEYILEFYKKEVEDNPESSPNHAIVVYYD